MPLSNVNKMNVTANAIEGPGSSSSELCSQGQSSLAGKEPERGERERERDRERERERKKNASE